MASHAKSQIVFSCGDRVEIQLEDRVTTGVVTVVSRGQCEVRLDKGGLHEVTYNRLSKITQYAFDC